MKNSLLIFFLFITIPCFSQTDIIGTIKDSKSKIPIPYCAVGIKNTARGCISNDDGIFKLNAVFPTDTLVLSFIGYTRKLITLTEFVKSTTVYLEQKENTLAEVVVYSDNDYLYEALQTCRKKLLQSKAHTSKAYFVLESDLDKQPAELVECYYNAAFDNAAIHNLDFKNGRIGLAAHDGRYFVNMNTSRAIGFLNLVIHNKYLPTVPLQLDKRKLKKQFILSVKSVYDSVNPIYHIEFTPRKKDGTLFSGELWIEKNSGELKKIKLKAMETNCHPFLPVFKDFGEIKNVSMQIEKVYATSEGENKVSHIDFDYQINYHHIHNATAMHSNADTSFVVNCKGLLLFYDYKKLFYIPAFSYDKDITDYRKITSLTYNENFWSGNEGLVYSDKMKQSINYFKKNGQLINYKTNKPGGFYKDALFKNNYVLWDKNKRLSLKKDEIKNDTLKNKGSFLALAYQLNAQLFFDINMQGDSVNHYSCSIFDTYQSHYDLKEEPFTNCFLNIYFDLFEIERRDLEKQIRHTHTLEQMDSLYRQCATEVQQQSELYLKEVERGKNFKALSKWNDYVMLNLGINNIALYSLTDK